MDGGTRRQIAHYLITVDSVILELGCCEDPKPSKLCCGICSESSDSFSLTSSGYSSWMNEGSGERLVIPQK